jgi:glycosyltransferase involved in cell wall biosynthesis
VQPCVNGLLVEPDAPPETFARAVATLVDDNDLRHRYAEAARAYALSQSWDTIMGALRDRYLNAIEQGSRARSAPALIS